MDGVALYEAVDADGQPIPGPRVGLVGLTHGNEVVGGMLLDRLDREVEGLLVAGSILAVKSNLRAYALGRRYTPDGTDLNRLWDADTLRELDAIPPEERSYEQVRALSVAPLLQTCAAILDLHSTTRPTPHFLVMRDDQRHLMMAYRLRVDRMVTGIHESGLLGGGLCPDVGLRAGESSPRLGFTYEAGQHADPANVERAWEVAARMLDAHGLWRRSPPEPEAWTPEVFEVVDRVQQVSGEPSYRFVGYIGGEPTVAGHSSRRVLASFEDVGAGEVVLRRGRSEMVRAQYDFTMLLPTPAAAPGEDLYCVAQRRETGLILSGEVRSHEQAFREARAVERMLDVLHDDAFGRGETLVCFDSRMTLDLCAELVGRTLRMPLSHPHRRFTVVGRGDWGTGEAERRAGRSYRQAVRRVMAEGVPSERFQLLRGATFHWFRQLTGPATRELMRLRAASIAPGAPAPTTRLYLSERQPHTVSVVAVGDLERAIRLGDTRHVRVCLLVEAATVRPTRGRAEVQVVRAGLFSSRPEILRAITRLIDDLRAEHRHIIQLPPLRDDSAFRRLLVEDGAIEPRADEESMLALREALGRVQVRRWQEALRPRPQAERLESHEAIGRWVRNTVVRTGILDEHALRSIFLVPEEDGARVDPSGLEHLDARGGWLPTPHRPHAAIPPAPLLAVDVDADSLPRWLGWKRYLRTAQVIPHGRGRDVDLAVTAGRIRRRLADWYRRARQLAERSPGDVLVLVASDGAAPQSDGSRTAYDLNLAHLDLVRDPNVVYMRIQHAPGTHLEWLCQFAHAAAGRELGTAPLVFGWDAEHGASASVILVGVRQPGMPSDLLSLDGWRLEAVATILAPSRSSVPNLPRVGMFTDRMEPGGQAPNEELLQFGRAHAARLLGQARDRTAERGGAPLGDAVDAAVCAQLTRWIRRARYAQQELMPSAPAGVDAESWALRWLGGHLGLVDRRLTRAVRRAALSAEQDELLAAALWHSAMGRGEPTGG